MTPPPAHSPDLLCAQILAEAARESEETRRVARAEAEVALAAALSEAERIRREQNDQAQAEAARRREMMLATATLEIARLRAGRIESLLESIHAESRRLLSSGTFAGRETAVALAAEAIRGMDGNGFTLKISPASFSAFGGELAAEITGRTGRSPLNLTVLADSSVTDGGVLIESADGRQIWDNRLVPRLERQWTEIRRQLAAHFAWTAALDNPGGAS